MKHDAIGVIDFGGQYAHLIATKVRRLKVLAEIRQPEDPIERFTGYKGIIVSGSPSLASQGEDSDYNKAIYDLDVPIIGFCFGHQEIAQHYGGKIIHDQQEWGPAKLQIVHDHPLFSGLGPIEQVWMSHYDSVASVGPEFEELGFSTLGDGSAEHRFAAIGSDSLKRYGFQYHPEVDNTVHGDEMIANFVFRICECNPSWTIDNYGEEKVKAIREQVGEQSVFLLASGGVDSTVAAKLFGLALGSDRLHLLHIDNGLMRQDESRNVLTMFEELGLGNNLHFVDATAEFLEKLEGVVEPERKRRIIGDTFVSVFESEAKRLNISDHLLGQGTIYPDTIETGGTKRADTIKTHHNRVPVLEEMIAAGRVVEPLAELYKVEVRELGESLGIPPKALWRHPFPGPGLGVRLLCSNGVSEDLETEPDGLSSIAADFGLEATVLPIRSVGVKADLRSYEHPALFSGQIEWDKLIEAASAVFKTIGGINRAIWNLGDAAPKRFRVLAATMTRDRLDLLRQCDFAVMEGLRRHNRYDEVWQCPTVLVPLEIDGEGSELCIIRPVLSERAMTAEPASLPKILIDELKAEILSLDGISGLALDITSKPPGTIEWE